MLFNYQVHCIFYENPKIKNLGWEEGGKTSATERYEIYFG